MDSKASQQNISLAAYGLSALVAGLAIFVWGQGISWQLAGLSIYQIFPVFGLLAFSIMWSHYVVSFISKLYYSQSNLGYYYKVTGYAVLVAIIIHPALLILQRFRDGFGLPPGSTYSYVQPSMRWVVALGTVSLLAFLAFELQHRCSHKTWWKYVVSLNDAAMLAIFYHGLKLGSNLSGQWFQLVWYFYGISLVAILLYKYISILIKQSSSS